MTERKGSIKANTQDILPIIKKWLYSEHDIFLRELISNASDAITKRKTLAATQNLDLPEGQITIHVDSEQQTIRVVDNGLGMTEEEVEKYIAQIAYSGAQEFVDKMKSAGAERQEEIIGKFGLGFYSAFMVAKRVVIDTKSFQPGSVAVQWESDGGMEYTFRPSHREEVGTTITLHLNEESEESKDFLEDYKVKQLIHKYCDFMPYPIYFEGKKAEKTENEAVVENKPLNETSPLWKMDSSKVTEEQYKEFFHRLFPMESDPLFWIHLKVDHPFDLKGILYFPKFNPTKPVQENNIRLFAKQVFVSDNVKSIVPEFLSLLKGAIDSPDIPLNVSRSSLQGDPNVKKISNYIIRKVAEALKKLFQNERERYQKVWNDISLFVKYGIISDEKFDEMMREMVLFTLSNGELKSFKEIQESIPSEYSEKLKNKVIYYEKGKTDLSLVKKLEAEKIPCVEFDSYIDPHFVQHCEFKKTGDQEVQFKLIDNEIENIFTMPAATEEDMKVKDLFNAEEADQFEVEIKNYGTSFTPAYFKIDEQMKRLQHLTRSYGQGGENAFPIKKTLVVNPANPLIQNALKIWEQGEKKELANRICRHVVELANFSSGNTNEKEEKEKFVTQTEQLLTELTNCLLA